MSVKKMAEVWECDISAPWQQILLAMADRADDDGKSLFPSAEYLAWKTGKSERQVRALWSDLRKAGVLKVLRAAAQHYPTHYQIDLFNLPQKTPWEVLRELKRQSRPAEISGLEKSEEELSTGSEKPRDEKTAGLRPEETTGLESSDLKSGVSDLQSSVARPEAGFTQFIIDSSEEEEGEGEEPPLPLRDFWKEGGWEKGDRWLFNFLSHQPSLPDARDYLLENPIWWSSVGIACHWSDWREDEVVKFLQDEFAKLAAAIFESTIKKPLDRRHWLKRVRKWLTDEIRWREEKERRAEKKRAVS